MTAPDPLRAWLLDEAAPPPEAAAFTEPPLPPGLAEQTLAACLHPAVPQHAAPPPAPVAANRPAPGWRVLVAVGAAAAALLVWVGARPEVGDPAQMTARGDAERAPQVALKMAARREGQLERLHADRAYSPGDTLYFRAWSDAPGWYALVVSDRAGLRLVQAGTLAPGEADLRLDTQLLAWVVEPGDSDASFALVSSPAALSEAALLDRMGRSSASAEDPQALCEAARRAGLGCDAARVEVAP